MEVNWIGAAQYAEAVRRRLALEMEFLRQEGVPLEIVESRRGGIVFFRCLVSSASAPSDAEDCLRVCRHCLANALSDVVVNEWERHLVEGAVNAAHDYLSLREKDAVLWQAHKIVNEDDHGRGGCGKVWRKSEIAEKVFDYLAGHEELVLDGFVLFRLKPYIKELREAVDRAVDEFFMEREYREFVRLLKYFVNSQEPRVDEAHVVITGSGMFRLVDTSNRPIAHEALQGLVADCADGEISYEDLLVSSLIAVAPGKIVVHSPKQHGRRDLIGTIADVFGKRVVICEGCELCRAKDDVGQARTRHKKN